MNRFEGFDAAVYSQHLLDGAREIVAENGGWTDGGYVGLTMDLARYADDIARYVQQFVDREWPGVYDYEVVTPLGEWLARNRDTYVENDREFKEELATRTKEFFEQ